jgi:uroporphyrinogen-III synthase
MSAPRESGRSPELPLAGCRVLVSRAKEQAGALSSALRELGCQVIEIPFIEIRAPRSYRPLDAALRDLAGYDWLILTSVNGVESLWQRLRKFRIPRTRLKHLQIAAIGPATKRAIVKHGLKVKMMPEEYVAEAVVKGLHDKVNGKRVLLVRAKVARDVIPDSLRAAGAHVDVVEAYETVVPEKSRIRLRALFKNKQRRPHLVTFTSSSTVRNFAELLGTTKLNNIQFASIGPVTSATLRELELPVSIEAREFTMGGLIRSIVLARYAQRSN